MSRFVEGFRTGWHALLANKLRTALTMLGIVIGTGGYFGTTVAVRSGGKGDVTSKPLWRIERTANRLGSGVVYKGHVYILNTNGIIECHNLKTGKVLFSERVRGTGSKQESWSSMIIAGNRIYVPNQSGETIVMRASPKFDLIGIPYQIILGSKSTDNKFEFKEINGETTTLSLEEIKNKLLNKRNLN